MKVLSVTFPMVIVVVLMGLLSSLFGCESQNPRRSQYDVADAYTGLRDQVLQLRTTGEGSGVRALLIETGYPEAVATLVVVHDGTTSLYFSNGGGVIGAGAHQAVRSASADLLDLSMGFADEMTPASEFPLPEEARVRFYLVRANQVLTAEAAEDDLGHDRSNLSPLFYEAHRVIAAIREHSPE